GVMSHEAVSRALERSKPFPGRALANATKWVLVALAMLESAKQALMDAVDGYVGRFEDESLTERTTTDEYYDVATDFYLYGWGHSFHFATRFTGESLEDSIVRHEHFLSGKLGLKPGDKVADLGMGVGGPLRSIQKFSNADITGVTINDYQVRRARKFTRNECSDAMARHIDYRQGDFTKLVPDVFATESLDAVYYIESSCHIANRTEVFQASAKALKKGAKLFSYEWVMTDRFDPANPEHVAIKKGIEIGDGIEDLVGIQVPLEALRKSGFRILEHGDLVELAEEWYGDHNVPWYFDMAQKYSFSSFRSFALSDFGQRALGTFLWMAGQVGLVPEEASRTEQMLRQASINLVKGGELKIFTPMYYVLAEKM
ncbi:Cycloartenol-C-24-methyltransferase (24-sterol C-methyltransferase 1) (Sterol C-methyltransferase 1) (Protein CEPHALOPOD) (Protein STEROL METHYLTRANSFERASE 1), partial [Durusdinium trenchii]